MGTYRELPVIEAPSQSFSTTLAGKRVAIDLDWNETSGRWYFALSVDDVLKVAGRRIIMGVDLLAPFQLRMGALIAVDWEGRGASPGRQELPSGRVRLMHYEDGAVPE
jgi:hypothetical protein